MTYAAPKITELGSVLDMTLLNNKLGMKPDAASQVVPSIVGSLIPAQP